MQDLAKFPDGDLTEVGERGLTLSGGQKARIGLARIAYTHRSKAGLVLLDDPLSAVDPGVGADIFADCIRGHLSDRLCLLVTNQHHLLKQADLIVVIREVITNPQTYSPSPPTIPQVETGYEGILSSNSTSLLLFLLLLNAERVCLLISS